MKRTMFEVKTPCGKCNGSGKGGAVPTCPQCAGQRHRWARKYANELTDVEFESLGFGQQELAIQELLQLRARNARATMQAAAEAQGEAVAAPLGEVLPSNHKSHEESDWLSQGFVPRGVHWAQSA